MCKKEYSTKKSLVNHVRVYHTGEQGKKYLYEFMVCGHFRVYHIEKLSEKYTCISF